ncbi:MAG: TetR/AcrR family transcriptional regulator [Chitinophagaceae bacterium]|nr:TetR/AcrR family transcriptional regulator [Chitinophagaceae bacterium]
MVKNEKDQSAEERILMAAKKVFVTRGLSGARMQDIADEAGINKALLHYYFRNKEKLFETIFAELFTGLFPRLRNIFESDLPLFDKIERFCSEYIDYMLQNPHAPIFVLNEIHQRPEWFVKKALRGGIVNLDKLIQQITSEIKAGRIISINPIQLIMHMLSLCIFPFIGKPMLASVMEIGEETFLALMEARKKEVPKFIIGSIKK